MSQQYVDSYFNTRKRPAAEDVRTRAKVLVLDDAPATAGTKYAQVINTKEDTKQLTPNTQISDDNGPKLSSKLIHGNSKDPDGDGDVESDGDGFKSARPTRVVRNLLFDSPKSLIPKGSKTTRSRTPRPKKIPTQEGQTDIRRTLLKLNKGEESIPAVGQVSIVRFEKKGALSPTKRGSRDRKETVKDAPVVSAIAFENNAPRDSTNDHLPAGSTTPKKSAKISWPQQDLTLDQIKKKIGTSSRLAALRASIAKINNCAAQLDEIQAKKDSGALQIRKFEQIELQVPVSPQKSLLSPRKVFTTPTKHVNLPENASPQRRLLFTPKEISSSPSKDSPTKLAAYQRYQSLIDTGIPALILPYDYRFIAEIFRCVDSVAAMLFNRREVITFRKLKPAVQEMLRRNFTIDHLAQIKTIFPNAYNFSQEKLHNYGSASKQDKYELVIVPVVERTNGRDTPDADDVLKSASQTSMSPSILLERKRIFYNTLLALVKDQHERFLMSLEPPMIIPKEKITRWHPEFDVESCNQIEKSELPTPPDVEKLTTARDVLQKAKALFNCNTRMEKALQRLAEAKMTAQSEVGNSNGDAVFKVAEDCSAKVEISIVDTPPATPTAIRAHMSTALKGIPTALLEKVRAKQAAKALEAMTRTPNADKEASQYARLPELARILRNIFVAEKKGVLPIEIVVKKLDNSFRAKLTNNELEEHVRLLCKLLPTWTSVHTVRKVGYLKLSRDTDLNKVVRRLETMANEKVKA